MNLKKLMLASIFILMGGCDEVEVDQALLKSLWAKTAEAVGINPATPMPEIVMMDEDLYREILRKDCESDAKESYEDGQECLIERRELELSVLKKTGKNYEYQYGGGIWAERALLAEDCESYSDNAKRKQCEADKFMRKNSKALARAYFQQKRVEIYYKEIWSRLYDYDKYYERRLTMFSYGEKFCYFLGIFGHEMFHIALYIAGVNGLDHHQQMKDKYMDPLLDFISDSQGVARDGIHRELNKSSLNAGIAGDQAAKRIYERRKSANAAEVKEYDLVLPCGLRLP